ncbi:MAG TPA: hypothetical protein VM912_00095 [Terriglobales bacterium]|nr:hypothetical protein [Terriglobales bacterium]
MKKKRPAAIAEVESTSGAVILSRGRKMQTAIENVFRLTHKREMTPDERRIFGLLKAEGADRRNGTSSAGERRNAGEKRRRSEL